MNREMKRDIGEAQRIPQVGVSVPPALGHVTLQVATDVFIHLESL